MSDEMFYFENLLRNEYFPAELPPCFSSETFADKHQIIQGYVNLRTFKPAEPLTFSGYKNINSRRKFAIPNPCQYAKAADVIVCNAATIFQIYNESKVSLTVPLEKEPDKHECYKKPTKRISDSKEKIEKIYQSNLYEIRLDIQSFFDSVYTHSISWAMHTKEVAKQNKNDSSLTGNLIDKCLQNLNSGQTNGILVGNAISRIASEIILCVVDKEIKARIKSSKYLRYVDDYYIFIKDSSMTNDIIAIIRQELAKYGLVLNENKLQINESPFLYGKPWVEQMRAYARLEPKLLLEKAIIEYRLHKDISILKYALKVIRIVSFSAKEWKTVQATIFNLWVRFPSLSNIVTVILKNNEKFVSATLLKRSIYSIIDTHVALKNDEEVIWAIWIAKIFNISLSQEYTKMILDTDNWLAIIVLLDVIYPRKSQTSIKRIINRFRKRIVAEYFSEEQPEENMYADIWLLAYEADKNKWLNNSSDTFMFARKNEFFKILRESNVDFYNGNYQYEKIELKRKASNSMYITRKEIIALFEKCKTSCELEYNNGIVSFEEAKECFYQGISDIISDSEEY
nr:RNA-directed DNA polymerase [uncultured Anaeromusa sp.]